MGAISQLLFPSSCLLCNQPGVDVCSECSTKIRRNRRGLYISDIPVWAGAVYGDELSELILLAKEKHILPARNFLAELLVESFMRARNESEIRERTILVPVPSSKSANRTRGYRHAYLLARQMLKRLPLSQRGSVSIQEMLVVNRKVADQTNLNREQRERNVKGAYSVTKTSDLAEQADLYLIDDLLTTGSSVREGIRALRQAGLRPAGVLTAGVSPRLFS